MLPLHYRGRWLVASILLLIFTLSAAIMPAFWVWDSKVEALRWFENADKWLHGGVFLVLSVWFTGMYEKQSFGRIAIGLAAFGVLIELLQRFLSYRTADVFDIVADVLGIGAGLLVGVLGAAGWCLRLEQRWMGSRTAES